MTAEEEQQFTERLLQEERIRAKILSDLSHPRKRSWLSENTKWVLVTIAIPFTTFLFGVYQEKIAHIRAAADLEAESGRRASEALLADARADVGAMTALLPFLADPDPAKSEMAINILRRLQQAQRDRRLDATIEEIENQIRARRASSDPAERSLGARQREGIAQASGNAPVLEALPQVTPPPPTRISAVAPQRPDILYIQLYHRSQTAEGESARQRLRAEGVAVPAVENVARLWTAGQPARPAQVRYFNDEDLGKARWTADFLGRIDGRTWNVLRTRVRTRVPVGQIEVWWPTP